MLKQLEIRNRPTGLIWQIYHVETDRPHEQKLITEGALSRGFQSVELNNELTEEESCPGWRESPEWKQRCKDEGVSS